MATQVVPTTNIGIKQHLVQSTNCSQTTNLSLASICSGDTYGGITNTFGAGGGPAFQFDKGLGEYLGLEEPPMEMSNTIGGGYL
tara:strand:+ start:210 stop:461 length:252 start_codon:yes stop_codon:yes gene_type:complete